MLRHAACIFQSFCLVLFMPGSAAGLALFAGTLMSPGVALGGLTAAAAAHAAYGLVRGRFEPPADGALSYNPLLMGLVLGATFGLTPVSLAFIAGAGVMTLGLSMAMQGLLGGWFKLPVLSLPFVLASWVVSLASMRYPALAPAAVGRWGGLESELGLPAWAAGFLRALGGVLAAPSVVAGAVCAVVLLVHSRILFSLAVGGYALGVWARGVMMGDGAAALAAPGAYNFILVAMALGGLFLVPSPSSYLIAGAAVVVTVPVLDATGVIWAQHGMAAFPLAFNLVTLAALYALGQAGHRGLVALPGRSPEETLELDLSWRRRHPGTLRTLRLPFNGVWTVWQADHGPWTHQGDWRHAFDFVITDTDGGTHRGFGARLDDYYCFRKPVVSPVHGSVVAVVSHLPDNPPGVPDTTRPWGNHVVIHDPVRGFFIELSHFAVDSIRVKPGDWVEAGAVLGLCGASGNAAQPHVHVQAQATAAVGAASLPFSFVAYQAEGEYRSNENPGVGERVEPTLFDRRLDGATTLLLDQSLAYRVQRGGRELGTLSLSVGMGSDGTYFLASPRARLYFGKHEGTFYLHRLEGRDPWLAALLMAMPRVPLTRREALAWRDVLPAGVAARGAWRAWAGVLAPFVPRLALCATRSRWLRPEAGDPVEGGAGWARMETKISTPWPAPDRTCLAVWDDGPLAREVRAGDLTLTRVDPQPVADVLVRPASGHVAPSGPVDQASTPSPKEPHHEAVPALPDSSGDRAGDIGRDGAERAPAVLSRP